VISINKFYFETSHQKLQVCESFCFWEVALRADTFRGH
jgi:hypothetical protein